MAAKKSSVAKSSVAEVRIKAPALLTLAFTIRGTAPYVQNRFSAKAMEMMRAKQEAGTVSRGKKVRESKDFQAAYEGAKHISDDGWCGIPASSFRCAMISACRLVGFKMTLAKLSVFIEADGFDKVDQTPLIRITKGEPEYAEHLVRNATGVADIRARPLWKPGWEAVVRITFDTEQFSTEDVSNLLARVGAQVGIGEGRPDSKMSTGMGWGLFEIINEGDD